ncbi:hypothetical protein V2J09_010306 [Rumex salicifolius]
MENPLRLTSLNHISIVCRSLQKSLNFYQNVLGFIPIRRPGSFDFEGAWLFNFSFGIHLLQSDDPENMPPISKINPKDNHISFQCESMGNVEDMLKNMNVEYVKSRVEEGGIGVDQIFFHDPDGMMIEVCNCDVLPIVPIGVGEVSAVRSCSLVGCSINQQEPYSPRVCQQSTGSRLVTLPSMDKLQRTLSFVNLASKLHDKNW